MSADYHLLEAEQDCEEKTKKLILEDAAIRILMNEDDSLSALRASAEAMRLSFEADSDTTGVVKTLSDAQRPCMPAGKERQVAAIARSLENADLF